MSRATTSLSVGGILTETYACEKEPTEGGREGGREGGGGEGRKGREGGEGGEGH